MADESMPGRARPVPERFEVFESDATAHLTDEQKQWKVVKLRPRSERFEVLKAQPTLLLKLHLAGALADADQVALAADICGLVQALSDAERDFGGGGLELTGRRAEPGAVVLTLRHGMTEGAGERAAKLAELLSTATGRAPGEAGADVIALLGQATSPQGRVRLLVAGFPALARCEVLSAA